MNFAGMRLFITGISTITLLSGCAVPGDNTTVYLDETVLPRVTTTVDAPIDAANDFARLLGGLAGGPGAALNGFRQGADFKAHEGQMAMLWKVHEETRGREIRAWSATQLGDLQAASTVFYPFSGPDFLFADAYFPHARRFVLAGLESIHPLPDSSAMSPRDLGRGLDGLSSSLRNVFGYGYFQTKDMRSNFGRTQLRGVLPIMLAFASRSGHVIESIEAVGLSSSGEVVARAGSHPCPGVRIVCRSRAGVRKEIFYFQEDLGDGNLRSDRRILHFARAGGRPVTYLKSASYLLHGAGFGRLRDFIVSESRAVVQDPSGIPFRNFDTARWNLSLYGFYHDPLQIFSQYYQADLVSAYEGGALPVLPIGFGAGYQINAAESSLLVARRR